MYKALKKIYSIYNNAIAMAIISFVFGLVLLIFPIGSVSVLSVVIGVLFIVAGCFLMGNYFLDQATAGFTTGLGLFPLVFGILLIVNPRFFIDFIPTMFGIYMLFLGLGELSKVSMLRNSGYNVGLSKVMAISTIAVGMLCMIFSWFVAKTAIRIVGAALIYKGISKVIYDRNIKKNASDFFDRESGFNASRYDDSDIIDSKFKDE
ncbi:HdeD family acid-resistance protein [Lachnobacterium bovis]|uniref:Uncharacterized membrane protein HdeD, DUF308 family n=1 Tax=Lachnobacterium bovis TaxID=140626 RepID=A0A1H9TIJ5_9FIRM|nr:DUF308 domain-containing protein [Lachnobacterium bovis]SER96847.1 Uncharacterized membrane protein HdeD, DUF308 family [Lachnobacterium bovis]